jgi:HEPN domain-containing protein
MRNRRPRKQSNRAGNREFRYTHDLSDLIHGLERFGVDISEPVREAVELTQFAWQTRYPGPAEAVSHTEYRRAVALAERVVEWAEQIVERMGRDLRL